MTKTTESHIQVYSIWINGRLKEDTGQHFPLDNTLDNSREWNADLTQAVTDYYNVKPTEADTDNFQDYHVALFSIDIDVNKFAEMFAITFDIDSEDTQEMIPYYVDYDFNVVSERVGQFQIASKKIKYVYYILSPYTNERLKELNKYYDNEFTIIQKKVVAK
jgi:hypothetical protein